MNDPEGSAENLLARWSRRKRAAETAGVDSPEPTRPERQEGDEAAPGAVAAPGQADLAFDPASLPAIETLTAASDVRAFLAPGVPEELTRAALRRVWQTDPTIRGFVGLAENQWDFTNPAGVPGFGSLELTPALRRLLRELIGDGPQAPATQPCEDLETGKQAPEMSGEPSPGGQPAAARSLGAARHEALGPDPTDCRAFVALSDPAPQQTADEGGRRTPAMPRRHGSALPR